LVLLYVTMHGPLNVKFKRKISLRMSGYSWKDNIKMTRGNRTGLKTTHIHKAG